MEAAKTIDGLSNEAGRITYYAYMRNPLSPTLRKKRVFLTFVSEDDEETLGKKGLASLRQARISRLCREAYEQGTLLSYDDLIHLLMTSMSTLKRDLRFLRRQGLSVPIYRKKQRPVKGN